VSTATDTRLRGATRWSTTAKCPRQASYAFLGVEPEPPSDQTRRFWRRGRQLGADVADDFAAKYGEENIIREKAIPWPAPPDLPVGELHSDVFVIPEKMVVEVKSSRSPASILDTAITQLGGELLFDPEAESAALAIVDPTGFKDTTFIPVLMTEELQERVESYAGQVVEATRGGDLPARVCGKPSDGHSKFCPFIAHCFEGWQKPDPSHLPGDAALIALNLKAVQDQERAAKGVLKPIEEERKRLAGELAAFDLVPGVEYSGAGALVTRTHVGDTERLSLTTLKKAGMWTPELEVQLLPFVTASGAHDRWRVERDESVPDEDDFGGVPWDDDDEGMLG